MSLTEKKGLYWSIASDGYWQLHLAATEEGLCYVGALHGTVEELTEWAAARMPDHALIPHSDKLSPYTEELVGYLSGARRDFSVPLSLTGTPFQLNVWEALLTSPMAAPAPTPTSPSESAGRLPYERWELPSEPIRSS